MYETGAALGSLGEVPGSKKKPEKTRVLTKVMVLIKRGINYDSKNDEKHMKTYVKPLLLTKMIVLHRFSYVFHRF